jgi:magnesium-transporting ATPase (P-type)
MFEKPRNTKESLFSRDLAIEVGLLGITITVVVFRTWYYLIKQGVDITAARSVIMMLMVLIQNINVFNCHSEKKSILDIPLSNNKLLIYTVIFSVGLQLIMAEIPLTARFLRVEPLPFTTVLFIFFISLVIIFVYEIYKALYNILRKEDSYEL